VFVYFDNDRDAAAAQDARRLTALAEDRADPGLEEDARCRGLSRSREARARLVFVERAAEGDGLNLLAMCNRNEAAWSRAVHSGNEDFRRLSAGQDWRGCDLYRSDAGRVRPGAERRGPHAGGRAAGTLGGSGGSAVRGPAGELLDRALERAGTDRGGVCDQRRQALQYWEGGASQDAEPGRSRPAALAVSRDRLVEPSVLVCLGATASRALLGPAFRLLKERGRFVPSTLPPRILATIHPSAVLRARDDERGRLFELLAGDLAIALAASAEARRSGGGTP
jgi:DNA polymerase